MSDPHPRRSTAETEQLLVSYETRGPADGPPVLLLHGWPDDPRTWDRVAAHLAAAGFRTVAPATRGCGGTLFRDASIPRTAEVTTLAHDALELLDVMGIQKATVIGHDWGARAAYAFAALWPERVERLVGLASPYETGIKPGSQLNYDQGKAYWYQWFFGSERGREALQDNRRALCRHCWQHWSPTWKFTEEEFTTTAASWDNPDWVEITLHSYRMRWGNAPKDARSKAWEAELEKHPTIKVPTVQMHGALDGATLAGAVEGQAKCFSGSFEQKILPGAGHFIPREAPAAVVEAISG